MRPFIVANVTSCSVRLLNRSCSSTSQFMSYSSSMWRHCLEQWGTSRHGTNHSWLLLHLKILFFCWLWKYKLFFWCFCYAFHASDGTQLQSFLFLLIENWPMLPGRIIPYMVVWEVPVRLIPLHRCTYWVLQDPCSIRPQSSVTSLYGRLSAPSMPGALRVRL